MNSEQAARDLRAFRHNVSLSRMIADEMLTAFLDGGEAPAIECLEQAIFENAQTYGGAVMLRDAATAVYRTKQAAIYAREAA